VNRAEVADAYERFETVMRKPIVTLTENDCLLFNDGTDDGFRYPVARSTRSIRSGIYSRNRGSASSTPEP